MSLSSSSSMVSSPPSLSSAKNGCTSSSSSDSSSSSLSPATSMSKEPQIVVTVSGWRGPESGQQQQHITLTVTNVVCTFSTRCHLNLRKIALQGMHVEYRKEVNMVNMKIRKPATTASMWSSGKCTCTGAQTESDAYRAARRYCRILQKMNFKIKMANYRVVNVLATTMFPFQLDIVRLAEHFPKECTYEPELHPGATFKVDELKATLKLFSTGSITLTAPSVNSAKRSIEYIYPILERFKFDSSPSNDPIRSETTTTTTSSTDRPTETSSSSSSSNNPTSKIDPTVLRNENLEINQQPPPPPPSTQDTSSSSSISSSSYDQYHNHSTATMHHNNHHHHNSHHYHNSNSSSNSSSHHYSNHHHHNNHHHHYDPWSHHHHHHHHHHHTINGLVDNVDGLVGVGGVVEAPLQPPLQAPPATNSAAHHHWFGDNLLIDNVLDDFLQ